MFYEDSIIHSGVAHDDDPPGRGSGRYGWGTGENPYQHQYDFVSEYKKYKKQGMTDAEIAKIMLGVKKIDKNGNEIYYNSTDIRAKLTIEKAELRKGTREAVIKAVEMSDGNKSAAARLLTEWGVENKKWGDTSVASLLDEKIAERRDRYQNTADLIKDRADSKRVIDIGTQTELYMGVTANTKSVAVSMLEGEGYHKYWIQIPTADPKKKINMMVLAAPDVSFYEACQIAKEGKVGTIQDFTPDKGKTWWVPEFPASLDSKRVHVRYAEDGGKDKDGVIELKRGVEDISLNGSQYAQVRIAVDGTHYMKGMAMYAEDKDFPPGCDVIYNTNKKRGTPALGEDGHTVMKLMKKDKDGNIDQNNPFGASIKNPKERDGVIMAGGQRHYIDKDGKERLSPINKLSDEGDWDSWSRTVASQFLSKQPLKIIENQLNLSIGEKKLELEQIQKLTNPVIKKKLLEEFASGCDANAVDLSAIGFKNQAFQVLLPIPSMKDNEVYAPRFEDGDTVALVRYPHGGTFEIPILKVNNKQPQAKKVMFDAHDAVGINSNVAERLSGADFDGDTALVIPLKSNRLDIVSTPVLKDLVGFDPKEKYKLPDDAPKMKNSTKQNEMGRITNLINDMSVAGAGEGKICRAVKHSMVVIDAEKHHLDYRRSEKENGILELKKEFQGVNEKGQVKGASTILSRASNKKAVDQRKEITDKRKMTPEQIKAYEAGKKIYVSTEKKSFKKITDERKMTSEELQRFKEGKNVFRETGKNVQERIAQMDLVDDAMQLVHNKNNKKEVAYANFANDLKALACEARAEARAMKPIPVSQSAKKVYAEQVASLDRKLRIAQSNAPRERMARSIADSEANKRINEDPTIDFEHRQRIRAEELTRARAVVGAKKEQVVIDDKEWEAIQAHAISNHKLEEILNNTNQDALKQRATPRSDKSTLTPAIESMIERMSATGNYTQKEIADRVGLSVSTVSKFLKENS